MHRFYWLDDGRLAGCSRPGARPGRSGETADIRDDLDALRANGIAAILTLTETALPPDLVAEAGLVALHLPVTDFAAPSPDQFPEALRFIDEHLAAGRAVAVHCLAHSLHRGPAVGHNPVHILSLAAARRDQVRRQSCRPERHCC